MKKKLLALALALALTAACAPGGPPAPRLPFIPGGVPGGALPGGGTPGARHLGGELGPAHGLLFLHPRAGGIHRHHRL